MFVLAPLEALLVLILLFTAFWLFRKALNSRKLDTVIEEVAHPDIHNVDGALEGLDHAKSFAAKTVGETEVEIQVKQHKTDRLRKAYGG